MKPFKKILPLFFVLLFTFAQLKAQTLPGYYLLNRDTITRLGSTDTSDYMPIQINTDGKVIVSGNQKISATQYDATTSAELAGAAVAWSNSFNTSNLKYFVTASTHDAFGNIYNVGAARQSSAGSLDYFVQKLDGSGTVLWTTYYDGPYSLTDVATAVAVDMAGDVCVTGVSDASYPAFGNYTTILYDPSGNQLWAMTYDNGALDIPTDVRFIGSDVTVSGTSASSFINYDFCTVSYDRGTGSQTGTSRTSNTNTGAQDEICSVATDNNGNVYNVGTRFNGSNYDLYLQKLDTSLNVVWSQPYDGGFDDAGINLALDSSSNIYVTGYSTGSGSAANRQLTVVKFNSAGSLQWAVKPCAGMVGSNSEGLRIRVRSNNLVFVGGNLTQNGNQDVILLAVDASGKLLISKTFDGAANGTDKFMDLTLDAANHVYASARSFNGAMDDNLVLKYSYKLFTPVVDTSSLSGYKYDPNELIIEFNKKALKMAAINDKNKLFGQLNDFVSDSTCNKITDALDHAHRLGIDAKHFSTQKVFYTFTEADTITQSRLGDNIRLHDYYCYLQVTIPSVINNIIAFSSVRPIKPDVKTTDYVFYLDIASTQAANDPEYGTNQGGLHPTNTFPVSNINCDSAWTIAGGQSHVKVGIFDTGINYNHPDMAGQTQQGYNFDAILPLSPGNNDDSNHGMGDAGLVGAVRNNNIGIAGIAGKDANDPNVPGVTIVDCKVCSFSICPVPKIANGILTGINTFGLDIMNLSINTAANYVNVFPFSYGGSLVNAMNDANRAGIALTISKGNYQYTLGGIPTSIATWGFPGDYSEEIIMCVGSTGSNGHHCVRTVNCSNSSAVWGNIDFSAPGTDSLIKTLDTSGVYRTMDGTSIASPHVAGAAALLMSYRNTAAANWDNMDHEDCEHILELTCFDLVGQFGEVAGYDTVTGWGRININQALKAVNKNYYRFRHITRTTGSVSSSRAINTLNSNINMYYDDFCVNVPSGSHSTDVLEVTTTINYLLNPGEVIIDAWPMTKACFGNKLDTMVHANKPYYSKIISYSNTQAILKTYFYKYDPTGAFFPLVDTSKIASAITLYTYDSTGTVGINNNIANYRSFAVYPNPSAGIYNVVFNADYSEKLTFHVYNIIGQEVKTGEYTPQLGRNEMKLSLTDASAGVYIFSIFDKGKPLHTQKLIKTN